MRIRHTPICILVLAMALALYPPSQVAAQEDEATIGSWEGKLDAPGEGQLTVVFHVARGEDGDLTGTFDSPDQTAAGFALSSVTFEDGTLTMVVSGIPGPPSFSGTLSGDGKVLSGAFVQLQFEIPLELTKRE